MKVAVIIDRFPVVSETFIINQLYSLRKAGVDLYIFSNYYNVDAEHFFKDDKRYKELLKITQFRENMPKSLHLRIFRFLQLVIMNRSFLDFKKVFQSINFFKYGKSALTLYQFFESYWFLSKLKFDIIHAHFGKIGLFVLSVKKRGFIDEVKFILSLHGYFIEKKFIEKNKILLEELLESTNVTMVNSEFSVNILRERLIWTKKLKILPVGLDTKFFKREGDYNADFEILFCGRLVALKGVDLCIEILNELHLKKLKVRLKIIGDGPLKDIVKKKIVDYSLGNYVNMLNFASQAKVRSEMNKASVLLLPGIVDENLGKAETQGLVIQEAQSMGLPVVISNAGGMKYGIIENETGFIIRQGKIGEFVHAIQILIQDRERAREMGIKGRQFVKIHYDNTVLNKRLMEIYKSC